MYTVSSADIGVDWGAEGDPRIAQNIRNLLRLWQGEVPYMRRVGMNPRYLHRPSNASEASIINHVHTMVDEYEPDADVLDVRVRFDGLGRCEIEVDIEVSTS